MPICNTPEKIISDIYMQSAMRGLVDNVLVTSLVHAGLARPVDMEHPDERAIITTSDGISFNLERVFGLAVRKKNSRGGSTVLLDREVSVRNCVMNVFLLHSHYPYAKMKRDAGVVSVAATIKGALTPPELVPPVEKFRKVKLQAPIRPNLDDIMNFHAAAMNLSKLDAINQPWIYESTRNRVDRGKHAVWIGDGKYNGQSKLVVVSGIREIVRERSMDNSTREGIFSGHLRLFEDVLNWTIQNVNPI